MADWISVQAFEVIFEVALILGQQSEGAGWWDGRRGGRGGSKIHKEIFGVGKAPKVTTRFLYHTNKAKESSS